MRLATCRTTVVHAIAAVVACSAAAQDWTVVGGAAADALGTSVAAAGDVDGDGYDDVVVGVPGYDGGELDEGRVELYLGSSTGLGASPDWTFEPDAAGARLGFAVAPAGDVDGDGFADFLASATGYSNGEALEGAAYLFRGSATGPAAAPSWVHEGGEADAQLGAVGPAGDVDGDGYHDVVVGLGLAGGDDRGRARLFLGGVGGLAASPAWTAEGDRPTANFGHAVATAGDVDGDGFADVIVGAPNYDTGAAQVGAAFVYRGSAAGLEIAPAWIAEGQGGGARFGFAVATAGDIDGDGYADIIVGAPGDTQGLIEDEGLARLYRGGAAGLEASPSWLTAGGAMNAELGAAVATVGDIDGDGFADVAVGVPGHAVAAGDQGQIRAFLGSAAGLAFTPVWTDDGDARTRLGASVALAGDVDGDGWSDVLAGGPGFGGPAVDAGTARMYRGGSRTVAASESWWDETLQSNSRMGWSVGAGDFNGDGHSDALVGAPALADGELEEGLGLAYYGSARTFGGGPDWMVQLDQPSARVGSAVAAAGDVDGDGYTDALVAAPYYDNNFEDEGIVLLYRGSPTGLEAAPAWTMEGGQSGALLGAVAAAGDVDGDGFGDVVIGAGDYNFGDGMMWVFHGSAAGLDAVARTVLAGQPGQRLGAAVASAGDVDGDGYSDVLVGLPGYTDGEPSEGAVYLLAGAAAGLVVAPVWSVEADQDNAFLGAMVASAGDVDADGYADILISAPNFDDTHSDEGRVMLFRGGVSWPAAVPDWSLDGEETLVQLGTGLGSAGDVDGDGFSDVLVSSIQSSFPVMGPSRVRLFHGSSAGLGAIPEWTADYPADSAALPVASAGDVDGDGHGDILVGSPSPSDDRVFLYLGNDGDGLAARQVDRVRQQVRADLTAPIDLLGAAPPDTGFVLRVGARGPFGRDRVQLEWEVKPLATPFDGVADVAPAVDTGAPQGNGSVLVVEQLVPPPLDSGPYRWRVRLRTRSPYPWASHWMTLPLNAVTETDLRVVESCAGGDLTRITDLRAVKDPPQGALFVWTPDPAAPEHHLNSVTAKTMLIDPRQSPLGVGTLVCTAPLGVDVCLDPDACAAAQPDLYYQLLPACGANAADEGPW